MASEARVRRPAFKTVKVPGSVLVGSDLSACELSHRSCLSVAGIACRFPTHSFYLPDLPSLLTSAEGWNPLAGHLLGGLSDPDSRVASDQSRCRTRIIEEV